MNMQNVIEQSDIIKISTPPSSSFVQIANHYVVLITLPKNKKRSWKNFKEAFRESRYWFDARKCKNGDPILEMNCPQCKKSLKVYKTKDFPLEDVKCNCTNGWFIKWETIT